MCGVNFLNKTVFCMPSMMESNHCLIKSGSNMALNIDLT